MCMCGIIDGRDATALRTASATLDARERIDEGIRQFDNCVECHPSADEDDIKGGGKGDRGKREDD